MLSQDEALWSALVVLKFKPFVLQLRRLSQKGRRAEEGRPVEATLVEEMKQLLGCDFRDVRIYDDRRAGELARVLGAEAFTVGNKVFAAPGKLNTTTLAGKALLAHELTHVAQQTQRHVTSRPAAERSLPRWQTIHSNADHQGPQVATSSVTGASGRVVQGASEAEAQAQAVEHSVREAGSYKSLREAEIGAEDIADRVYLLMQSELILERERARV